jgi:hypothetical protein
MPDKNTRLLHHLGTVIADEGKQLALVRKLDQQELAIREDPELTAEQKRRRIQEARFKSQKEMSKLDAEIAHAAREGEEATHEEHRDRKLDPAAHARVRDLLAQGVAPVTIRERAAKQRDPEMLAALRTALLYFNLDGDFADTQKLVNAIDRDLADVGEGVEADNNRAIVELDDALQRSPAVREFAWKKTMGEAKPLDRLRMAFATGQGKERDDA